MRSLIVIAGLLMAASVAAAEPLAILRGIVVTQYGEPRAYLEDPHTGKIRAYVAGDAVADGHVEAIHEDRVVLRRGNERVQLLMGPLASAPEDGAATARATPEGPSGPAVYRPNPDGGPIIGNGQPWLDRLGISSDALSRAIDQAPPPQDRHDIDD